MRCNSCGKDIPTTSQVCPYCLAPISVEKVEEDIEVLSDINASTADVEMSNTKNLTTINNFEFDNNNNELNFGDLASTSYDSKNDITANYKEKETKKKKNILPYIIIPIILIIGVVTTVVLLTKKNKEYLYYQKTIDYVFDYLDEVLVSTNGVHLGTLTMYYSSEIDKNEITGTYALDVNRKLFELNGKINERSDNKDVVITHSNLSFDIVGNKNNYHLKIPGILENDALLTYDDVLGLIKNDNYNIKIVLDSIHSAIKTALADVEYTNSKNVKVPNSDKKTNKITLTLDNMTKKNIISTFFMTLSKNNEFMNELAKIKNTDVSNVTVMLNETMSELETKYARESDYTSYINIYYKDDEVYCYEFDMNDDIQGYKYIVEYSKGRLFIKKYKDNNEVSSLLVNRKVDIQDSIRNVLYQFEIIVDGKKTNVNVELKDKESASINPYISYNFKDIRDYSKEELLVLKNRLSKYTSYTDWIYKLPNIFGIKCSSRLNCNCNNQTCSCTDGKYNISCTKQSVRQKLF